VADDWDQRTLLCLWHRIPPAAPPQSSVIHYIRALG
jgi:hypothetical protein